MVSKIPVYLNRIKTNLKLVKSKEVKVKKYQLTYCI